MAAFTQIETFQSSLAANPEQTIFAYFFPLNNVFSICDMEQLGKIRREHWKERLKIIKTDKFESDAS